MGKTGKIILIGAVLILIAVPLAFLIKHNFSGRLTVFQSEMKTLDFKNLIQISTTTQP